MKDFFYKWVLTALIVLVSSLVIALSRDRGIASYVELSHRVDSLKKQCLLLEESIRRDSLIVDAMLDSQKFEHYLREECMFLANGETMYLLDE